LFIKREREKRCFSELAVVVILVLGQEDRKKMKLRNGMRGQEGEGVEIEKS
jgi:hypothetical protein